MRTIAFKVAYREFANSFAVQESSWSLWKDATMNNILDSMTKPIAENKTAMDSINMRFRTEANMGIYRLLNGEICFNF